MIAWLWAKRSADHAGAFKIPLASGLVAGESLFAAILAILCAAAGLVAAVVAALAGVAAVVAALAGVAAAVVAAGFLPVAAGLAAAVPVAAGLVFEAAVAVLADVLVVVDLAAVAAGLAPFF